MKPTVPGRITHEGDDPSLSAGFVPLKPSPHLSCDENESQAAYQNEQQMKPKQADEVEWMVGKRDQLMVTALASATKIRPERSGRVPLAQPVDAMHPRYNRYYGTDERHGDVQSDLHGSHLVFGSWASRSRSSQSIVGTRPLRPRPTFVSAQLKIDIIARSLRARQAVKFVVLRIVRDSAYVVFPNFAERFAKEPTSKVVANCRKQNERDLIRCLTAVIGRRVDRD
ncbi:hypothetical protein [Bradyrhizobium sp. UNPF46]|uniref:hypothetical protein n=1 Tax=Bradyrhizobium sp. UNPF46 TaxID=1141168 RepID=UPI001154CD67|nr:hypothetical protein [Bradyrhizobium sp. UNPF46]